ncbi:PIN domain-containing protein [Xenorhabdus indica]|uniref:PIN domain-containing protein n=1 Tax=Xenorhabdus indica TaxID=333964 RepID=UPI00068DCC34|nr:twitching motility protein PilT [Xenorhabdus indica]
MEVLLDTNILLFMAYEPEKLKTDIIDLLEDTGKTLCFSAASIWEVIIKSKLIDFVSDYITVIPNR